MFMSRVHDMFWYSNLIISVLQIDMMGVAVCTQQVQFLFNVIFFTFMILIFVCSLAPGYCIYLNFLDFWYLMCIQYSNILIKLWGQFGEKWII